MYGDSIANVLLDARELQRRVFSIEREYSARTGSELGFLEAANAFCRTRYPNGSNIGTFVSDADPMLLDLFYKYGVYDTPRMGSDARHRLNPGVNNPYISWPAAFTFFSGVYTALNSPKTLHARVLEACAKYMPGVRLDMHNDEWISRWCGYGGVGEQYRDALARGMLFSLPGELFQKELNIHEVPELRAEVLGLEVFDRVIKETGMQGLAKMKMTDVIGRIMQLIPSFEFESSQIYQHYSGHFIAEEKTISAQFCLLGMNIYMETMDAFPALKRQPGLNYFYNNVRSSATHGYAELPFHMFPVTRTPVHQPVGI